MKRYNSYLPVYASPLSALARAETEFNWDDPLSIDDTLIVYMRTVVLFDGSTMVDVVASGNDTCSVMGLLPDEVKKHVAAEYHFCQQCHTLLPSRFGDDDDFSHDYCGCDSEDDGFRCAIDLDVDPYTSLDDESEN